jgi:hypothetical protein
VVILPRAGDEEVGRVAVEQLPGMSVTVERDVPLTLADGVTLYADVYRPGREGPHPVLLTSHPYNKLDAAAIHGYSHPAFFANRGYVVVSQDVRGRFRSEGEFTPFVHEAADLSQTITWASLLPGADGRVGTYGFSYPGLNQLQAAGRHPEGLAGIAPGFTGGRPYRDWFYTQGALGLAFAAGWATFLALDRAYRRGDDAALGQLGAALAGAKGWYWMLPLDAFPPVAADAPFFFDWLAHPTHDEYWRALDADFTAIDVPGLHVGGWYDVFVRGTVHDYVALAREARAPQKLVLGPWYHMPWRPLGGETAAGGTIIVDEWLLRFYDHVLKGVDTGVFDAPATVWVMQDGWRDLDGWPPSQARPLDWFLHSGGRAQSRYGDGTLSPETPGDELPDVFTYDPGLPVQSQGGHSCCLEAIAPMGPSDQAVVEESKLVLVYTSGPLARDLEVIGDVTATVYAATTATDTDFVTKLCVVDPAGRSVNLLEGIVRARFRDSSTDPRPVTPGEVVEYRIELGPIAVRVPAGHRLRVHVTSSDFPQWDRNLNTGGPLFAEGPSAARVAIQTVLHDREHPSRVTLPVLP